MGWKDRRWPAPATPLLFVRTRGHWWAPAPNAARHRFLPTPSAGPFLRDDDSVCSQRATRSTTLSQCSLFCQRRALQYFTGFFRRRRASRRPLARGALGGIGPKRGEVPGHQTVWQRVLRRFWPLSPRHLPRHACITLALHVHREPRPPREREQCGQLTRSSPALSAVVPAHSVAASPSFRSAAKQGSPVVVAEPGIDVPAHAFVLPRRLCGNKPPSS
ncbi:hypothetical protein SCHPADRAFT_20 [Schizopora paradoxa]|uniref:Uncharacterized protein n=1 Tax=Schizopora paradoxa TaxID=27342 RepID=A0A0H2S7S1_9AGAM|nr:hypothetical protein SCHPADRAFT_20 [Schizopora paradoxa]